MKVWKMPLSELADYVTCEFVGGELIAMVEGKRISMGRKYAGMFEYSQSPAAQELLQRVITDKVKLPAKLPLKPKKSAAVEDAPIVAAEPVKRTRKRKVAINAEVTD
jgi:hypothetical protein